MRFLDFRDQLRRQLGFIERSCKSYDAGFVDEGVRIASVLRVIFHHTPKSTSLLKHLGVSPNVLTTVRPVPSGVIFFDSIGQIAVGPAGAVIRPKLGNGSYKGFLPYVEWWRQLIYVRSDLKITRRDIILAAANKDGGAHVDRTLTPEYEELRDGVWTLEGGTLRETRVEDYQFVFLRQAGYEVLNSPDILALAR